MTDTHDDRIAALRPLAAQFPTIDAAIAEIARLSALLTLPKGTIHVISDVHGEDKKLRHVINNASGTLRPLIEKLFQPLLPPEEFEQLRKLILYPGEVIESLRAGNPDPAWLKDWSMRMTWCLFELVRELAGRYSYHDAVGVFPAEYHALLSELLQRPAGDRGMAYVEAIIDELHKRGRVLHLIHLTARVVRNLAIEELVIGGDLWDRGPRGDRVVTYLMKQPATSIVWGNHDAAWLGAGLGCEALICSVLRISLRYRNLRQLEEGYGIPLQPVEKLAREVYGSDPAARFTPKGTGLRDTTLVARMQKAVAVMQFKLEGAMIDRNPQWGLEPRKLLHRMDLSGAGAGGGSGGAGTVTIDGKTHPLLDSSFPTLDPANPYELNDAERACMKRMVEAFRGSPVLWEHLQFIVHNGSMWLERDGHLIFHGCTAVDEQGAFLPLNIDGRDVAGKAMFEAVERVVVRAMRDRGRRDLDLMWYLWCGPRSPLFGKDKITTFESYFVADKATHKETKNPYFNLIHEAGFCDRVLAEFGVDPERGLIVNGHVPVKITEGESPLKRSGKAITIDGAFSQAYGDHGFTLVLEPGRTFLAKHHHFESVESAIREGVDIVPELTDVRRWSPPRRVADTEKGAGIRAAIRRLEQLVEAYEANNLRQG